ncbi:Translation elongation factor 1 beta [Mucor velutinosus]|uniref:Translation elongation factor 1 beta n=1 Tax=Mucor velutinosus TaxID=708070 RepID=A0AAN7I4J5_9FUNG|nr:Translation elongation factor 1 beta [Mucor velutinosus]
MPDLTLYIGKTLMTLSSSVGSESLQQCSEASHLAPLNSSPTSSQCVARPPLVDPGVSFAPLVDQFCLHDGQPLGNAQASAKTFRLSVLSSMEQPLVLQHISVSHWKFFWSLSLTYIQRNVIYRLITGCIPSRSRLHYMMPGVFESHNCPACLSPNETASHLLFDCRSKEKVWQGVIFEFLWPTTSIPDIKEALLSLDFFGYLVLPSQRHPSIQSPTHHPVSNMASPYALCF